LPAGSVGQRLHPPGPLHELARGDPNAEHATWSIEVVVPVSET